MITLASIMTVPYVDGGRDLSGLDCWGLVRLVRHHHHGLPLLESFGRVLPDDKAGMTRGYHDLVAGFVETAPVDGAIACHFLGDALWHVGVVVDECGLKVLHTGRKQARPSLTRLAEFERMAMVTRYYIEHDNPSLLSQQTGSPQA